ncbi:MAG: hypothetical protein EOO24_03530 [Comamonadaceae bacterium]|nr:MAG: hypothetical protein EOO24_03530 [Comamonadaceae bacterium]
MADQSTRPASESGRLDPIGPHDEGQQPGGQVIGGGGEGEPPLNFDDDEIYSGRGNHARAKGTDHSAGGDSGRLGPPSEQFSDHNAPSDPDAKRTAG